MNPYIGWEHTQKYTNQNSTRSESLLNQHETIIDEVGLSWTDDPSHSPNPPRADDKT